MSAPDPSSAPAIASAPHALTAPAAPTGKETAGDTLDRLADQIADRLAVRLTGLMPAQPERLVDAAEIARMCSKTRSWVYEHAGELGAIRLGNGSRPRLGFSPARVAAQLEKVSEPEQVRPPERAQRRRRAPRANRTATGAPLLHVRPEEA
jgi:hypothetical protein